MAKIKTQIKKSLLSIMPGNNPDFIIIGAQKSGTTFLHYYLKQHPNLTGSNPKEIHYFDRLINHGYSLKWYKKHFIKNSLKPQLYFETTPNYIYYERVAKSLHRNFPEIKLILILRDPVERAFSAWNMYRNHYERGELGWLSNEPKPGEKNPIYRSLFENRTSFPEFMETLSIEKELIKKGGQREPAILRRGLYAEQLENYYHFFDKKAILILGFKDLVTNLKEVLDKCTSFLGVKNIDFNSLKIEPKNTKTYSRKMNEEEELFLKAYYKEPNEKLFQLLGYKPNW